MKRVGMPLILFSWLLIFAGNLEAGASDKPDSGGVDHFTAARFNLAHRAAVRLGDLIINHPKPWVRRICKELGGKSPNSHISLLWGCEAQSVALFKVLAQKKSGRINFVWQVNAEALLSPSLTDCRANNALEEIAVQTLSFFKARGWVCPYQ